MRSARAWAARACAVVLVLAAPLRADAIDWQAAGRETATLLSGYLRIDTSNPPGNELAGARYLERFFAGEGIGTQVLVSPSGRASLVARMSANPRPARAGPLLLLSHLDVVPADPEGWSFPPFSGEIRDGFVHGRGALDDKGQGAVFAMALSLLRRRGVPLSRDLVFCASAAEEAGSGGVDWLVEERWEVLGPPAVVWNEGGGSVPNPLLGGEVLNGIATTEKRALWLTLVAEGEGGHGSQPHPEAAVRRLVRALARLDAYETPLRLTPTVAETFRRVGAALDPPVGWALQHLDNPVLLWLSRGRLTSNRVTNAMVRDTISLTGLRAGLKHNVIPHRAEATLDVRLLPDTDAAAFLEELRRLIDDPHVRLEGVPDPLPGTIEPSPIGNELFTALEAEMARELPGSLTLPTQTTGGTDSAAFRARGVPAYGFMPALLSEELAASVHGLDERVPVEELERALRVTYRVLLRLAAPAYSPTRRRTSRPS
jgi:acetylornithine deacetylase/succinyl-diaminopimelate desuccinylase-like protein